MPRFEMSRLFSIQGSRAALAMLLLPVLMGAAAGADAAAISTQWNYEISVLPGAPTPDATSRLIVGAAGLLGSVGVGTGQDTGTIDKNSYTLRSRIEGARLLAAVISNLNVTRQSTGRFVRGVALTLRYTDKRGSSAELMSVTNLTERRYEFSKGGRPAGSEPLQVAASDLLMAPYAFIGRPAPSQSAFLALSDGKAIRQISLSPKAETMKVAGKVIQAVRLSGRTAAGTFDLWLRAEDSFPLRMRIGLGAKYGAVLDQIARDIPANLISL
ncbi:MAG: hypothetical protein ACYCZL_08975 [Polaromonas sp.]